MTICWAAALAFNRSAHSIWPGCPGCPLFVAGFSTVCWLYQVGLLVFTTVPNMSRTHFGSQRGTLGVSGLPWGVSGRPWEGPGGTPRDPLGPLGNPGGPFGGPGRISGSLMGSSGVLQGALGIVGEVMGIGGGPLGDLGEPVGWRSLGGASGESRGSPGGDFMIYGERRISL